MRLVRFEASSEFSPSTYGWKGGGLTHFAKGSDFRYAVVKDGWVWIEWVNGTRDVIRENELRSFLPEFWPNPEDLEAAK